VLALVFAGTFAFLGVGSGSGSGLLDIGNWFSHGSSAPSVKSLQEKVAKNPRDALAYLALGQALQRKGQTRQAIDAFQRYVSLRPRSLDGLAQLETAYQALAQRQATAAQRAASVSSPIVDPSEFAPGGQLGQALSAYPDALAQTTSSTSQQKEQQLRLDLQQTERSLVGVDQKIAALSQTEPSALLKVAQDAEYAYTANAPTGLADLQTALRTLQTYVKRFPDSSEIPQVKKQITSIKKVLGPGSSG
jgi:tetratricopeptide (TPR) repeat protein